MNHKDFLTKVTSFIRANKAKKLVEIEINQHLTHAKNAWMKKGYSEVEAEKKAVEEMGSATKLGMSLGKLHKPKIDWFMLSLIGVLLALSFLPLMAMDQTKGEMILTNALTIIIGLILIVCLMLFDISRVSRFGYIFYIFGLVMLAVLIWIPNGMMNGEARFTVGPITLSVWYVLPVFLIAWAALFSKESMRLWKALLLVTVPIFLLMLVPNLAVLFIFTLMSIVMLYKGTFTRIEKRFFLILLGIGVVVCFALIVLAIRNEMIMPYQLARIYGFLHPHDYAKSEGYLYLLLNTILSEANWFGSSSSQVIPGAHTDFVLSFLMQRYGIVVTLIVVVLLLLILARMCWQAIGKGQSFAKLLVIGASTLFSIQVLYAFAMTIGIVPLFSIPLPFISYGLMPTIINSMIVGAVLSVYRRQTYIFVTNRE